MKNDLIPLRQVWPPDFVARYRAAGYWRGETFPALLRERAARFAGRTAVVAGDTRWSYAELARRAERIGAGLLALGLVPGERVVVQMGNTPEFYAVVWGLFRAGLIPVYALAAHRITEIAHFARKSQASAYVAVQRYEGFDYRTLARELLAQPGVGVRHVVIAGEDAGEFTALDALQPDAALLPVQDPDRRGRCWRRATSFACACVARADTPPCRTWRSIRCPSPRRSCWAFRPSSAATASRPKRR